MKMKQILLFIIVLACSFGCENTVDATPEIVDDFSDSTKNHFQSFINEFNSEDTVSYKALNFLPDSVLSKIPKENVLYTKYETEVFDKIIVKINSNGKLKGEILLFCFSKSGDLVDYMIVQRYCYENCENVGLEKEMVFNDYSDNFEFEILEIKNEIPGSKPLITDEFILRKEKWKLNQEGKFIRKLDK